MKPLDLRRRATVPLLATALLVGLGSTSFAVVSHDARTAPSSADSARTALVHDLQRGSYTAGFERLSGSHATRLKVKKSPKILGKATPGEVLTATPGTWSQNHVKVAYRWFVDGRGTSSRTSSFKVKPSAIGQRIHVEVTASKNGYRSGVAASAHTAKVKAPKLSVVKSPVISGTPKVGSVLQVSPGTYSARGVTLTYQWLRGQSPIAGATRPRYRLTAADRRHQVRAVVTATRAGYRGTETVTDPTSKIKLP